MTFKINQPLASGRPNHDKENHSTINGPLHLANVHRIFIERTQTGQLLLKVVRCLPFHSSLTGCGKTQGAGVGQASREETAGGTAVGQDRRQSMGI